MQLLDNCNKHYVPQGKSVVSNTPSDQTSKYTGQVLQNLALSIWNHKLNITESSSKDGLRPRIKVQPSQLL